MRTAGIIVLCLGVLMTVYTGVNFVTKETVVDLGDVEVQADEDHAAEWSPFVGIAAIVVGGVMIFMGRNKRVL